MRCRCRNENDIVMELLSAKANIDRTIEYINDGDRDGAMDCLIGMYRAADNAYLGVVNLGNTGSRQ